MDVFCADGEEVYCDATGTAYETRGRLSILLGLYAEQRTTIATRFGPREERRYSALFGLFPFWQEVVYLEEVHAPGQAAEALPGDVQPEELVPDELPILEQRTLPAESRPSPIPES